MKSGSKKKLPFPNSQIWNTVIELKQGRQRKENITKANKKSAKKKKPGFLGSWLFKKQQQHSRQNHHTNSANNRDYKRKQNGRVYIDLKRKKLRGRVAFTQAREDKIFLAKRMERRKLQQFSSSLPDHNKPAQQQQLNEKLLESWDVPCEVLPVYARHKVTTLYDWQVACLKQRGVWSECRNLVYSAPTSGGKTLVAELLMLRHLLHAGLGKVLFVLPFVSMVIEKSEDLNEKLRPLYFLVQACYANQSVDIDCDVDVIVCTFEKANAFVNALWRHNRLHEITLIVVDEVHMLSDNHRGYLIELILSKFLYASFLSYEGGENWKPQIVALSATFPNIVQVATWLDAELHLTDWRPIPFTKFLCFKGIVYNSSMQKVRTLSSSSNRGGSSVSTTSMNGSKIVTLLCQEVTCQNHSVLVFCATRKWCENLATYICNYFESSKSTTTSSISNIALVKKREELLAELKALTDANICPIFQHCIPFGVSYHHAGMTDEERIIIEKGFRNGVINILCATSTLSAGVNLPARRVIFRSPAIGYQPIDQIRFEQMSGRAGRAGIDDEGESILIVDDIKDLSLAKSLLKGCHNSSLESYIGVDEHKVVLARLLLEGLASEQVICFAGIEQLVRSSLFGMQCSTDVITKSISTALSLLRYYSLIENESFRPSLLGQSLFTSGLDIENGLLVFEELAFARQNGLILSNELHLCYLFTPLYVCKSGKLNQAQKQAFFEKYYSSFRPERRLVGAAIGIKDEIVATFLQPQQKQQTSYSGFGSLRIKSALLSHIYQRFFIAMLLYDLLQEMSISDASISYNIPRGQVQGLQQQASTFANMISKLCSHLHWELLSLLASHYSKRLDFGVKEELLQLLHIPEVGAFSARSLYEAGFHDVESVSTADVSSIVNALSIQMPFSKNTGDESRYRHAILVRNSEKIIAGARKLLHSQKITQVEYH